MIIRKEFYYVRHGQTDHNKSTHKTDHGDIPLNDTGVEQARSIEELVASLPIKTVCCSPLIRAKQTKDIITRRVDADHHIIDTMYECTAQIWNEMTALGPEACRSDKEPVKSFMQKIVQGINEALSHPGPVLIVAHGGIHWAMCCHMGIEESWMINNCEPKHFIFADGKWRATSIELQRASQDLKFLSV